MRETEKDILYNKENMLDIIYSNLKFTIYDKNSKDLLKIDVLKFSSGRIYLNDIIFRL